ncbi:hypothetical protein [Deinococcus rufus]
MLVSSFVWTVIWLGPWGSNANNLRIFSLFIAICSFPFGVIVSWHAFKRLAASKRTMLFCGYIIAALATIISFIWPANMPLFCHENIGSIYLIGFEYNHGAWSFLFATISFYVAAFILNSKQATVNGNIAVTIVRSCLVLGWTYNFAPLIPVSVFGC